MVPRLRFFAVMTLLATACGSGDDTSGSGGTGPAGPLDVVYEGGATAADLAVLTAASSKLDVARAATFDVPMDGGVVSSGSPIHFGWHTGDKGSPPIAGAEYYLVFSTSGDDQLVRVLTTATNYKPDATYWTALTSVKAAMHAVVTTAVIKNGAVTTDGGPFEGNPITFTFQ